MALCFGAYFPAIPSRGSVVVVNTIVVTVMGIPMHLAAFAQRISDIIFADFRPAMSALRDDTPPAIRDLITQCWSGRLNPGPLRYTAARITLQAGVELQCNWARSVDESISVRRDASPFVNFILCAAMFVITFSAGLVFFMYAIVYNPKPGQALLHMPIPV